MYSGPASYRADELGFGLDNILSRFTRDVVTPVQTSMAIYWSNHTVSGLWSLTVGLCELFVDHEVSTPGDVPAYRSMGLNASFAIPILRELSDKVIFPKESTAVDVSNLKSLIKSLDLVIELAEALLEPRWEAWLALNRRDGARNPSRSRRTAPEESSDTGLAKGSSAC